VSWRRSAGLGPPPGAGDGDLSQRTRSLLAAYDAEGGGKGAAERRNRYAGWLADLLEDWLDAYAPPVYGAVSQARYPAFDGDEEDWRDYRD
jgi:hypothetical protein